MPTPENRAVARWSDALTSEGLGGGQSYLKVWHIIYRWKALELLYLAYEVEIERRSLVEEKNAKEIPGGQNGDCILDTYCSLDYVLLGVGKP